MSYPPLPSNGETGWGDKFRAWADAVESRKAEVSDLSFRHDNTVGTRVFLDHPGGSVMLHGDTGWRRLTSWNSAGTVTGGPLQAGMEPIPGAAGYIAVRRLGGEVTFSLHRVRMISSSTIAIPVGFRTGSPVNYKIISGIQLNATTTLEVRTGSATLFIAGSTYPADGDATYRAAFSFSTTDAWPTALPGTPL